MKIRNVIVTLLIAAAGYAIFGFLFARYSAATQWNVGSGPAENIARAQVLLLARGIDVRGWDAQADARPDNAMSEHLREIGSSPAETPASIFVIFEKASAGSVGVRFDATGRLTLVTDRRISPSHERAADPDGDRARAEAAFRAFVPDASSWQKAGEEAIANRGMEYRWEAASPHRGVIRRGRVIVSDGEVTDVRYGAEIVAPERRLSDTLDSIADLALVLGMFVGVVLYLVGTVRRAIPQRLALILLLLAVTLLMVAAMEDMDPAEAALFNDGPGVDRIYLLLGIVMFATVSGLGLTGGYPYLARRLPQQLLPFEALLLRAKIGNRTVASSVLVGLAAGGWIEATAYLIRATSVFGAYPVTGASSDALFRSAFIPPNLWGTIITPLLVLGVLVPFILDSVRGRAAMPLAVVVALILFLSPREPLAAAIISSLLTAGAFLVLFFRRDLLTVVIAAAGGTWAAGAATRLVQPADVVRHEGLIAASLLATVVVVFALLAAKGSRAPLALWQPRLARAARERMQREFEVARLAQERMLPEVAPDLPGISIASYCQPARQVGGDLYDFIGMGDDRVGIAVADVSGKGVPAALVMTITKGLLLAASDGERDPRAILAGVNAGIHSLRNRSTFVTMMFGVLDATQRTFQFVRAGHTALLWRKSDGSVTSLAPRGIGLGMAAPRVFRAVCETRTIAPDVGDFLLLYSDGVTEAMNERNEEYGDERLVEASAKLTSEMSADDARDALIGDVALFCGTAPVHDDMTLVVVKFG